MVIKFLVIYYTEYNKRRVYIIFIYLIFCCFQKCSFMIIDFLKLIMFICFKYTNILLYGLNSTYYPFAIHCTLSKRLKY